MDLIYLWVIKLYLKLRRLFLKLRILKQKKSSPLVDCTEFYWNNPSDLVQAHPDSRILLRVPLSYIYFQGERLSPNSQSFYIRTVVEYLNGKCTTYKGSVLERYYEQFQPKSAAERLPIQVCKDSPLRNAKPEALVTPWSSLSLEDAVKKARKTQVFEAIEHGAKLTFKDGHNLYGPVSRAKGELEYDRLISVANSIKTYGYRKSEGYPESDLLIKGNKFVFDVCSGKHRVAVLAALNYKFIELVASKNNTYLAENIERWRNPSFSNDDVNIYFDYLLNKHGHSSNSRERL